MMEFTQLNPEVPPLGSHTTSEHFILSAFVFFYLLSFACTLPQTYPRRYRHSEAKQKHVIFLTVIKQTNIVKKKTRRSRLFYLVVISKFQS